MSTIDLEGGRRPLTGDEIQEAAQAMTFPWAEELDVEPSAGFEGVDHGDAGEDYDEDGVAPDEESLAPEEIIEVLVDEATQQTRRHAYLFALANRGATAQQTAEFLAPLVDYMHARIGQIAADLFEGEPGQR